MRILIYIYSNMVFIQVIFAQSIAVEKHRIGMGSGLACFQNKDYLASPLTYRGWSIPVRLSYEYRGFKNRHSLCLSFSKVNLTSSISQQSSNHVMDDLRLSLEYGYHHLVTTLMRERCGFFLGGIWDNHGSRRELFYRRNHSKSYGELISSLDLSAFIEIKMSPKKSFYSRLSVPMVALVVRQPYAVVGPLSLQITSLNKFIRMKSLFVFDWFLSEYFNTRFQYHFVLYRYTQPQTTRTGMDLFLIEFVIKC